MEHAARQLLRALRGERSQLAFARRLGYQGNPIPRWEGGHRFPTAAETLRACRVVGVDVDAAFRAFHPPAAAAWSGDLAAWLAALSGAARHSEIAERAGMSRQQIGRILRGDSQPRLPEFLTVLEAITGRAADWVAELVDIDTIPALRGRRRQARAVRLLAHDHPWSPAVLAILDTLPAMTRQEQLTAITARLPLPSHSVEEILDVIETSGARDPAVQARALTVDVAPTRAEQLSLRAHWAQASADRIAAVRDAGASPHDLFSFNVFTASRADLDRIRRLQRDFYREVRGIITESDPEVAAIMVLHTAALEPASD